MANNVNSYFSSGKELSPLIIGVLLLEQNRLLCATHPSLSFSEKNPSLPSKISQSSAASAAKDTSLIPFLENYLSPVGYFSVVTVPGASSNPTA